ncbi:MAG: hypothetical protein ACE1Z9_07510, partial [Acidimicrobiia bacterium]
MSAAVGKARKAPTGPARAPPASAGSPLRFIVSALILGLRHVSSITWSPGCLHVTPTVATAVGLIVIVKES